MSVTFRMNGGIELERKLGQLPARVARKIASQAMRAGAKVIQVEAKANALVGASGQLRQAIKVRAAKRKRGRVAFLVQNSAGNYKGDTYYAAFQEFGYRIGPRLLGDARRLVPGKSFMGKAFDRKSNEAIDVIGRMLGKGIEGIEREGAR